jgi:hypothetical protein
VCDPENPTIKGGLGPILNVAPKKKKYMPSKKKKYPRHNRKKNV